jgi:hypothetical protein
MRKLFQAALLMTTVIVLTVTITPLAKGEVILNEWIPMQGQLQSDCADGSAGEMVNISGELHVVLSQTVNNNIATYQYHTNANYDGVGVDTGAEYLAPGGINNTYSFQVTVGQQYEQTFVFHYNLVGKGKACNVGGHTVGHMTVNANGEVIVEFLKIMPE